MCNPKEPAQFGKFNPKFSPAHTDKEDSSYG